MQSHPGPATNCVLSKSLLDSLCSPATTEFERMAACNTLFALPNGCWGDATLLEFLLAAAKAEARKLRAQGVDWEAVAQEFAIDLRYALLGKTVRKYRGYLRATIHNRVLSLARAHRREIATAQAFYSVTEGGGHADSHAGDAPAPSVSLNWGLLHQIDAVLGALSLPLECAANEAMCELPAELRVVAGQLHWRPSPSCEAMTRQRKPATARQQKRRLHAEGERHFGPTTWRNRSE